MTFNPSKFLFLLILVLSTLMVISSNSWLGSWIGLEINLISFIPLMNNSENTLNTESSLKYFLIQALASATLLLAILIHHSIFLSLMFYELSPSLLVVSALLMKLGASPFHFWFPGVMEGLSWFNCIILMTWQKIAPLVLISYLIFINPFTLFVILSSILIGSFGGLNQTSLRKLMAYSSISHMGWMMGAMLISNNLWLLYFCLYILLTTSASLMFLNLNIFHVNQLYISSYSPLIKFFLFTNLLSLGGLPPFLGFIPKWMVIHFLSNFNLPFMISAMVIATMVTLLYYMRITFSAYMIYYPNTKWINFQLSSKSLIFTAFLSSLSLLGFPICSILFFIY